jgi:hypothetical protein
MESGMATRKNLSKKTRFEVFKRDKFTCQYCGAAAPSAVLHVDHIRPVAGGGGNDILNLITACQDCNGGKGARRLDDGSEVQKQHAQFAELQARREQIEMMLQWREALQAGKDDAVDAVAKTIAAYSKWEPNETGRRDIRGWIKRYDLDLLLRAVNEAFETYLRYEDDCPTEKSWAKAFSMVPAVARVLSQAKEKPYLPRLFYIQGIVRKRVGRDGLNIIEDLERCVVAGATVESLERCACTVRNITQFRQILDDFIDENGGGS